MSGILQNVQHVANYIQGGIIPSPMEFFPDDLQELIPPLGYLDKEPKIIMADQVYNAADFTAKGAMTWTVEAADLNTLHYMIINKLMIVWFIINSSSVTAPLDNTLYIAMPGGKVCNKNAYGTYALFDNGISSPGYLRVINGETRIQFMNQLGNFTASVNGTSLYGQIAFEIQ